MEHAYKIKKMITSTYLYSVQCMNEDQLRVHKKNLLQLKEETEKKLLIIQELQEQNKNSNQLKLM